MTAHGLFAALIVSAAWILAQNLLMHLRPAENRFKAMVVGYLGSLPFVYATYRWLPVCPSQESLAMGLFHAYFFHLLLFFCYGECFYHVERSVTLRLLVELLEHHSVKNIQCHYNIDTMIRERLEVLRDRGFVEKRESLWRLCFKGLALARFTVAIAWLFRIKPQHERLSEN